MRAENAASRARSLQQAKRSCSSTLPRAMLLSGQNDAINHATEKAARPKSPVSVASAGTSVLHAPKGGARLQMARARARAVSVGHHDTAVRQRDRASARSRTCGCCDLYGAWQYADRAGRAWGSADARGAVRTPGSNAAALPHRAPAHHRTRGPGAATGAARAGWCFSHTLATMSWFRVPSRLATKPTPHASRSSRPRNGS